MGMTAYFDVEYTDAALDKQIAQAKRSGAPVPSRMSQYYPTFTHAALEAIASLPRP